MDLDAGIVQGLVVGLKLLNGWTVALATAGGLLLAAFGKADDQQHVVHWDSFGVGGCTGR